MLFFVLDDPEMSSCPLFSTISPPPRNRSIHGTKSEKRGVSLNALSPQITLCPSPKNRDFTRARSNSCQKATNNILHTHTRSQSYYRFTMVPLILVSTAFLLFWTPGNAMPSLMVEAGQSKCIIFEAAMDTIVKIDYQAPGTSSCCSFGYQFCCIDCSGSHGTHLDRYCGGHLRSGLFSIAYISGCETQQSSD